MSVLIGLGIGIILALVGGDAASITCLTLGGAGLTTSIRELTQ